MQNVTQIEKAIKKQYRLLCKLRDIKLDDYNNLSDNMMVSQAEYYIALEVLRALKKVSLAVAEDQAAIDEHNN
jgi:hypothetical protein|tara:strand:- start:4526 stop:4744 length:219 start_codon:yes stop_codon:yes gene_type:complete